MSGTRPANHDSAEHAGNSAGQALNRLFERHSFQLCAPDNYADWAMTRLDRAQCLIYAGDITSGLEYARETITTIAPAQRRGIITLRGRDIVETLPEGEKKMQAARNFRELLAASASNSEVESS